MMCVVLRCVVLLVLGGCAIEEDPCAGRRDLTQSEAGLVLTEAEHREGWSRTECLQCHPAWTLHIQDCIDGIAVDVAAIEAQEMGGCVVCHGANGVSAWSDGQQ